MKEFTEEELARYNGKNRASAYIAYKGKVYDVSDSFLWRNGSHQVLHNAGADLTEAIGQAPHSADVLKKFPMAGALNSQGRKLWTPEST